MCKKEGVPFTSKSFAFYLVSWIALLGIPIVAVTTTILYYSLDIEEFKIDSYFSHIDKTMFKKKMLTDIKITSQDSCGEFGEFYEPLFAWRWEGTKPYCLADFGVLEKRDLMTCSLGALKTGIQPVEHSQFFNKTICGERIITFGGFSSMLRSE